MKRSITSILIIILAIAAVIAAVFLIGAYLYAERMYAESYSARSTFSATLSADSTLENATFLLPLPSHMGRSEIGEAILAGEGYGIPDDWDCSLVDVEGGVMLRIAAGRIVPEYRSRIDPIPLEEGEEPPEMPTFVYSSEYSAETPDLQPIRFGVSIMEREQEINTRWPLGNESVLSPKHNLTLAEEEHPTPAPPGRESATSYYVFLCPVYAGYSADPDTTVTIGIEYSAGNEWWVLGWSGNRYEERFGITLTGPDPGPQYGSGSLLAGSGRYR